jgi:spore maturation protein CgeB
MKLAIFGLSITSSWGNGHATTYRGLIRALSERGHEIQFFECRQPWYADSGDLSKPDFCRLRMYSDLAEVKRKWTGEIADADAVIVGSYVPDGARLGEWVTQTASGATAFYDIDTPVTVAALQRNRCSYLSRKLVPKYDFYFSFTGGPTLDLLVDKFGAQRVEPLYCSVDPARYYPHSTPERWTIGYLGTYSKDRQPSLEELLFKPAIALPRSRFAVAGAQYPPKVDWPVNVQHIDHLPPNKHRAFYNAQLFTLNLTRSEMVRLGWSPSIRLFEAAACGTAIITDAWKGLEDFFEPGSEILVARNAEDVRSILLEMSETERREIGARARARVLGEHTAAHRARQLEDFLLERDPSSFAEIPEVAL